MNEIKNKDDLNQTDGVFKATIEVVTVYIDAEEARLSRLKKKVYLITS